MPTHDEHDEMGHRPEEIDTSLGYEPTDVRVSGVIVFLTALAIFVAVVGALSYGIGRAINEHMAKEDGPTGKWSRTVDVRSLGNMPNSPELQNKMAQLTQTFPTPRLQTDDGNQDVTDLHAREDLLLQNYSWADQGKGSPRRVRIPIERAMQLIAKQGLPVAPPAAHAPLLYGDTVPVITEPLTNGFARTGYEQDQAEAKKAAVERQ